MYVPLSLPRNFLTCRPVLTFRFPSLIIAGAVMDPDEVQDLLDELPHRFCKKEAQ
jgi:hypothetical protein